MLDRTIHPPLDICQERRASPIEPVTSPIHLSSLLHAPFEAESLESTLRIRHLIRGPAPTIVMFIKRFVVNKASNCVSRIFQPQACALYHWIIDKILNHTSLNTFYNIKPLHLLLTKRGISNPPHLLPSCAQSSKSHSQNAPTLYKTQSNPNEAKPNANAT